MLKAEDQLWVVLDRYGKQFDGYMNVLAESCSTCTSGVISEHNFTLKNYC